MDLKEPCRVQSVYIQQEAIARVSETEIPRTLNDILIRLVLEHGEIDALMVKTQEKENPEEQ